MHGRIVFQLIVVPGTQKQTFVLVIYRKRVIDLFNCISSIKFIAFYYYIQIDPVLEHNLATNK